MLQKGWPSKVVRMQMSEIKHYNQFGKHDMLIRNMIALKLIGFGGLAITLLVFMLYLTKLVQWDIKWEYWRLIPMYATFFVFSVLYGRQKKKDFVVVEVAGSLFSISLVSVLIYVSIFYYPNSPDELLCFAIVLMPLFFSTDTWIIVVINVLAGTAFCVLVCLFKEPAAAAHDIFVTCTAVVLSLFVYGYNTIMRANWFIVKEKYKRLSRTDLLTELLNKRSYEMWCQKMLDQRCEEGPCALVIFDLDNFKQINDQNGHYTGDRVLEIVGQTLAANFSMDGLVGRIGGDEFSAFVCTKKSCGLFAGRSANVVIEVKERARRELGIEVTMSMGLAVKKAASITFADLYMLADKDLYLFKRTPKSERTTVSSN